MSLSGVTHTVNVLGDSKCLRNSAIFHNPTAADYIVLCVVLVFSFPSLAASAAGLHNTLQQVGIIDNIRYTVGPGLNAWFNDCVLRLLPTLRIQ